jgi:hypothetical protein
MDDRNKKTSKPVMMRWRTDIRARWEEWCAEGSIDGNRLLQALAVHAMRLTEDERREIVKRIDDLPEIRPKSDEERGAQMIRDAAAAVRAERRAGSRAKSA